MKGKDYIEISIDSYGYKAKIRYNKVSLLEDYKHESIKKRMQGKPGISLKEQLKMELFHQLIENIKVNNKYSLTYYN